jgi:hypothetical protein
MNIALVAWNLFLFDPLQRVLILNPIHSCLVCYKISHYADDAGIFVNPIKEELRGIAAIPETFGKAIGLVTNMAKTKVFPVRCDGIDLDDIFSTFPAKIATFPGKYLGLPLHLRWLRKVDLKG